MRRGRPKLRKPIATLDNTLTKRNTASIAYKVHVRIRDYRPRISTEFCTATQPTQNLKEEETKEDEVDEEAKVTGTKAIIRIRVGTRNRNGFFTSLYTNQGMDDFWYIDSVPDLDDSEKHFFTLCRCSKTVSRTLFEKLHAASA